MFEFRSLRFARAIVRVFSFIFVCEIAALSVAQFNDPNADQEVLSAVPPGFEVSLFEREPRLHLICNHG